MRPRRRGSAQRARAARRRCARVLMPRASAASAPARAWRRRARRRGASSSGARSATAARWRGDGRLVAAGDRAGERALGPVRGPVVDGRAHERDERLAVQAAPTQPLGGPLERDEEVRGDRRGGVVGGAVVVGDRERASGPSAAASAAGERRGRGRWCRRPRRARRRSRAPVGRDGHQRVQRKASCGGQRRQRGRAGAVADEAARAARDGGRGGGDLGVGDAQQHDVGVAAGRAPRPSGPSTGTPAARSARGERGAEAAVAHDRAVREGAK